MKPRLREQAVPSWATALVVLVTAGVTVFAMLQTGYKPVWGKPQSVVPAILPWTNEADSAIRSVVPVNAPAATQLVPSPAMALPPSAVTVAAPQPVTTVAPSVPAAPFDGTNRPPAHGERGVCLGCHTIADSRGKPIPPIRSLAALPHAYRGVCVNCHSLAPGQLPTNAAAGPFVATAAVVAPQPVAPTPLAAEGEWMGLEVAPITSLTSKQFNLAEGTSGLVVVEAEAQAAVGGIRPGDVVVEINAIPIASMTDFFWATDNGTLPQGSVQVTRMGRPLRVVIQQTPAQQPAAQPPAQQPAAAGMSAAMGPPLRVTP
jgi:hypothetical protein